MADDTKPTLEEHKALKEFLRESTKELERIEEEEGEKD